MTDRELATHLWITQFPGSLSLCGPTHNHHCIKSQLRLAAEVRRLMEWVRDEAHHEWVQHMGYQADVAREARNALPLTLPAKDWSHNG